MLPFLILAPNLKHLLQKNYTRYRFPITTVAQPRYCHPANTNIPLTINFT